MEIKQINQLMVAMRRTGMKKLVLEQGDFKLELEWEEQTPLRPLEGESDALEENPMKPDFDKHKSSSVVEAPKGSLKAQEGKEDEFSVFITSPMVGTCYLSSTPKDPPFAKNGSRVEKNSVVCIIEAMKVMNEVKAPVAGIVAEALVENGSPVEFGTKLFRIIPAP